MLTLQAPSSKSPPFDSPSTALRAGLRMSLWAIVVLCLLALLLVLATGLVGAQPPQSESHAPPSGLIPIDIDLPSDSTGSPTGTLAVRVHTPMHGHARYPEGAPVLVWGAGGFEVKGINHDLPPSVGDIIIVTFVYPGGEDPWPDGNPMAPTTIAVPTASPLCGTSCSTPPVS